MGIRDDSPLHNFVAATADMRVAAPPRHLQRESSARPADPTTANKPSRFRPRYSPSAHTRPFLVGPHRPAVPAPASSFSQAQPARRLRDTSPADGDLKPKGPGF